MLIFGTQTVPFLKQWLPAMSQQQCSFKSDRPSSDQTDSPVPTTRHTSARSLKPAPLRRCAACRRVAPRSNFVRLIRQYDTGEVRIAQGMGRSAYLCPTRRCVEKVRKKNRLRHVLGATISDDLFASLLAKIEAGKTGSANTEGLVNDD